MPVGDERVADPGRRIGTDRPADLAGRRTPTHAATEESNGLQAREAAGSEIETVAREETDGGFRFITRSHGVVDAGVEEPIAPATVSRPGPGGHGSAPAGRIAGRGGVRGGSGQLSDASVSFQVADGRMIAAARAGSGW
ncbi:DUF5713 family protein [Streptomyces sp. NPDC006967]|uniref:DUF5713 family protein n=1 Tax=unclassified Streptomyces TaxID=2593676 RepID=UPI000CD56D60|nr:DUF5713 family protein [Streptomyces sp. SM1]